MNEADLSDDAIIELAREGGVAWIPTLSGMRKIVVAQLNEQQNSASPQYCSSHCRSASRRGSRILR